MCHWFQHEALISNKELRLMLALFTKYSHYFVHTVHVLCNILVDFIDCFHSIFIVSALISGFSFIWFYQCG